ncbi:MAG: hypothetical protein AAF585_16585, partial [Verrucomicrobiota bacterium]
PGPLFLVRNERLVSKFLQLLTTEDARKAIGVNLDIAHWGLIMKIQPDQIPQEILDRLVHVHLSDHSDAHLGDLPLGRKNDIDVFKPWVRLCAKLPHFDGIWSLELEAAFQAAEVEDSADKVDQLILQSALDDDGQLHSD